MQGCFYFIENRLIILWWYMDCPNHSSTQSFLMAKLKLLAQIQVRKTSYKNIIMFLSKAGLLVFYYFFDVFKEVIFEAAVKKWNKKKRSWFLSMLQKVFSYQRTYTRKSCSFLPDLYKLSHRPAEQCLYLLRFLATSDTTSLHDAKQGSSKEVFQRSNAKPYIYYSSVSNFVFREHNKFV